MLFFSRWKMLAILLVVTAGAVPGGFVGHAAELEFRLVDMSMTAEEALQTRPRIGSEILYGRADKQPYLVEKQAVLTDADICNAQPSYDQRTNEPVVSFKFGADGAKKFARVTTDNVGRPFAIVLDNEVISAPVIREPILGGSGQISGKFTPVQANDLANRIRAGAATKC